MRLLIMCAGQRPRRYIETIPSFIFRKNRPLGMCSPLPVQALVLSAFLDSLALFRARQLNWLDRVSMSRFTDPFHLL